MPPGEPGEVNDWPEYVNAPWHELVTVAERWRVEAHHGIRMISPYTRKIRC